MGSKILRSACADVFAASKRMTLIGTLGWQDVRQRYRRSALGPFWLTVSMGVMIAAIGLVFGQLFHSPMRDFLPFLTTGLILWGFISQVILEGCTSFIQSDAIIKQLAIPLPVHVFRMVWRNLIILAHNAVIFPLMLLIFLRPLHWSALLAIPGLALVVINVTWMATLLAVLCARYRDIPQIISSVILIVFYVTPIMWLPQLLKQRGSVYILNANPFYHLLEVSRSPLLGQIPGVESWLVSIALAIVGWTLTLVLYGRYRTRIAYWL